MINESITQALTDFPRHAAGGLRSHAGEGWLSCILDQIDYGIVLVDAASRALHANRAGRQALDSGWPLQVREGCLDAARPADAAPWRKALDMAAKRGLRTLLTLGDETRRIGVAIVPVSAPEEGGRAATLVVVGRHSVCESLSVQWFARCHGLTQAEGQVLDLLCRGEAPGDVARTQGVAVSTVRSQIGSIRAKTGASSIGALVRQVALLPPMVSALQASDGRRASLH
jgi:DNA-binding CsgD family transcriptional regulator